MEPDQVHRCLDEVETELFRIADHDECRRFHVESGLTAVVLLLFRSSSLLRPMLLLSCSRDFDGFDAVSRAFEESWRLAYEFRFLDSRERVAGWFAGDAGSWSARIGILEEFARQRGLRNPTMGRDYGRQSELAHPTRSAAENSTTLAGVRRRIPGADVEIVRAFTLSEERIAFSIYRLVWLMLDGDAKFIPLHVRDENMAVSLQVMAAYDRIEPRA